MTGVVGKTGSGKTTLISLIAGLINPSQGELLIDKKILNESNKYAWQNKISIVPQETIIIDGTISDNISLILDKEVESEKLKKVLEITKLEKFIPYLNSNKIMGERELKSLVVKDKELDLLDPCTIIKK